MSRESVLELLDKGAEDRKYRIKFDNALTIERFVELAKEDGYDFTADELTQVIRENGDSFESYGNPPKKGIWV